MKDRERIEQRRLKERVGGFQKYVDILQINNPDPISTYYVNEAQRFDKDFDVIDKKVRAQKFEKEQSKLANLREERFHRENQRWDQHEQKESKQENRIKVKAEVYGAAKKNMGGAAFNIINLDYDSNKEGQKLKVVDGDAKVRAMIRSKNLDFKNNSGFNILTGESRTPLAVPYHERYNPFQSAAGQVIGSRQSQRSNVIHTQQSQRSNYSTVGGILPGMK